MRYVLTTSAAIAACGLLALAPARAEPMHELGGPTQVGTQCWVSTSGNDQGYWKDCPKPAKAMKHAKVKS